MANSLQVVTVITFNITQKLERIFILLLTDKVFGSLDQVLSGLRSVYGVTRFYAPTGHTFAIIALSALTKLLRVPLNRDHF